MQTNKSNTIFFFLGIFILSIIAFKLTHGLQNTMDLLFGDEAHYMRNGVDLFHTIHKDWGPSYNIWYKLLSFFQSDVIKLYYLNYQLTTILIGVLTFVFLYVYKIDFKITLWLSACFLISSTVVDTWPRVSHFTVIILLLSLIIIKYIKTLPNKMLVLLLCVFICSYARPELFVVFYILSAITVVVLIKNIKNYKSYVALFTLCLLVFIFFFAVYQFPPDSFKGYDRKYIAFSQHYAINYVLETKAQFNPISEWIPFAETKFKGCNDFKCILQNYSSAVFWNIGINIKRYCLSLLVFISSLLYPIIIIKSKKIFFLSIILFFAIVAYVFINKKSRTKFIASIKANAFVLFFLLLFGLPSVGSSLVIFPRQHYLLLHSIFIIFIIALLFNAIPLVKKVPYVLVLLVFIVFIWKSPKANKYSYYQMETENKNQCNKKLIEYLTKHNDNKEHTIFSNHLSLSKFLPNNFSDFNTEYEFKKEMYFTHLLIDKKIDIVVMRDLLLQDHLLSKDTTFTTFVKDPSVFGFKKVNFENDCNTYLLIKE
ncbi:MAG: hypothetical protein H6553_13900 [Chitinophagales bacterium]|nr:hypothetical protein [Chitinophagales bacterium]